MSTETAMWLRVPSREVAEHMASALRDHVYHEEPTGRVAEIMASLAETLDACPRDLSAMSRSEVREMAPNLRERASYLLGVRVGEGVEAAS